LKRKVRAGFDDLLRNPLEGKPLKAELAGLWSLRVGRFRIIYRTSDAVLEIIAVGPRSTVYLGLTQKLARLRKGRS
jgi:mRNA-degrading endonuclease RelE of RelBE toxin-antitoxin system